MGRVVVIEVTQEHIEKGEPNEPCCGPIAFAATPILGGPNTEIAVYGPEMEITDGEGTKTIQLPPEARRFVCAFDSCSPVSPFAFTVELPDTAESHP